MNLIENRFSSGAILPNPIWHKLTRFLRPKIAHADVAFDFSEENTHRHELSVITIKNQGTNFSCGGQAASYLREIFSIIYEKIHRTFSAKSYYSPIAYKGGGTTVSRIAQRFGNDGALLESEIPSYYATGEPLSEAMMIEKSWLTPENITKACSNAGYTLYDCGETIDEVAHVIKDWKGVLLLLRGQNNGTWLSPTPLPPSRSNPNQLWAHFVCAKDWTMIDGKKHIVIINSLGKEVGDNGIQYISEDYFTSGHIVDAFTLIPNDRIVPKADNRSWWAEILRWWRQMRGLAGRS